MPEHATTTHSPTEEEVFTFLSKHESEGGRNLFAALLSGVSYLNPRTASEYVARWNGGENNNPKWQAAAAAAPPDPTESRSVLLKRLRATQEGRRVLRQRLQATQEAYDQLRGEHAILKRRRHVEFNNEECWVWEGDETDALDELTCPVVIRPEELQAILGRAAGFAQPKYCPQCAAALTAPRA